MLSEKKARELLTKIQADVKEAKDEILMRMDVWIERMSFYRGFHYRDFYSYLDESDREAREIHNYIPSFVKASVATRVKHFPNPQVSAADGNQKSAARAKATERLLKSFVDDDILAGEEYIRALHSAAILGGAWLKVYWDPFSGKVIPAEVEPEEVLMTDEITGEIIRELVDGEPKRDIFGTEIPIKAFEGKIKTSLVELFDGWPDPSATKPDEMRFWVHRKVRPTEELERRFPTDIFGKKVSWQAGGLDTAWLQKQEVINQGITGNSGSQTNLNNMCEVYEYWGAPNEDLPNGILCVFSGDNILFMNSCPYVPARIPAIFLPGDNIVPGGFYPDGVVEHLIQPQRTLNRAESKIREMMDRILNPHIMLPNGSGVDPEIFGEESGQVIPYNNGFAPHILHVPDIPSSISGVSANMVNRMQDISTYSDVTRGNVPGRVESGRAIAYLQENESDIRSPEIRLYKKAVITGLMHCLWLSKQYYPDGRMIRTLGEDSWALYEFNSADYDWDIDLAPEPFSGAPNSRALRWAETMEAFQLGIFNDDQPGAKEVRAMLEMDHQERSTVDKSRHHRMIARMENQQIAQMSSGVYPGPVNPVREFHDDEIHLEEHNVYRNSQDYLDLTEQAREAFDAHCEEHEENKQAKMGVFADNLNSLGPQAQAAPPGIPSPPKPS